MQTIVDIEGLPTWEAEVGRTAVIFRQRSSVGVRVVRVYLTHPRARVLASAGAHGGASEEPIALWEDEFARFVRVARELVEGETPGGVPLEESLS